MDTETETLKEYLKFIHQDLKEDIEKVRKVNERQDAIIVKNATILDEHKRRSIANERRIMRLEERDIALAKLKKWFFTLGSIAATIIALWKIWVLFGPKL